MAQVIDITGSKKNFNTTVVGASVTVIAQYSIRTAEQQTRFYYFKDRVFEFNNRPVWGENFNSFITPLVIATPSTRTILSGTNTNNAILVTGQSVLRAGTSTQVNSVNTASLFVKGSNPIRIPVNMLVGGVATVNTFTDIPGQPNIYGVSLLTTATWAFAIEQLPSAQTSGLSVNSIITVTTSSGSTGNFGIGNIAYVYAINSSNIIVVATTGTSAPVNGTITGITNTGQTFYVAPVAPLSATYLIVGGGGGGGADMGGGGGAGGYIAGSGLILATGTYPITVGAGGAGAPAGTSGPAGSNGSSTIALGFTALGGGGGASKHDSSSYPAGSGGSGGGGSGGRQSSGSYGGSPGAGTAGQGNNGAGSGVTWYPGGGGGAGAAASQTGSEIGHGGVGISNSILGSAYFWAGGGGGAGYSNYGGNGGNGGGGGGAPRGGSTGLGGTGLNSGDNATVGGTSSQTNVPGGNAGRNTGGGGGGGSHYNSNNKGGDGGSGIVVVRYAGSQRATGGTVTTVGGDTVHAFTATGLSSLIVGSGGLTFPTFRDPIPTGWTFTVTNLSSTVGYNVGDVISFVPNVGTLGSESSLIYITSVNSASSSISGISFGYTSPKLGIVNSVYPTGESLASVLITNVSASSPYTFTVSGLKSTSGLTAGNPGSVITATTGSGSFGAGNTVIVQSITGYTSLVAYVTSGTSVPIAGVVTNFTATGATASFPQVGQAEFTATGTFSWIAPTGITSVNVVAVGGGGGGGYQWSSGGGGAGGLGWKNNIAVTPGNSYTVVVGAAGPSTLNATNAGAAGGTSYFISTGTVAGYGGGQGGPNSTAAAGGYGGGYFGDGGGRGGNGAYQGAWNVGGGGAGGYSGNGADAGGGYFTAYNAPAGSGAGAASGYYSSTYGVPAGGGVGIYGRGADGVGSSSYYGGGGGSGGEAGRGGEGSGQSGSQIIAGGAFGGGGGGSGTSYGGGPGGRGAVRIIWGSNRAFPATLTADQGNTISVVATTSFKNRSVGGPSVLYPTNLINSNPYAYTQNVVPKIIPVLIDDKRRLVLQRTTIQKTGYGSLRYNTVVESTLATNSRYFSTGTLSWPLSLTSYPGGLGFIGTVTSIASSLPNIYGVSVASTSNWAFAIENLPTSQISSLSYGTVVTASGLVGDFGTGNTVWVYSTSTVGYVVFVATGGSVAPANGTISSISLAGQTYIPPLSYAVDLLVVGGGGSGGNHNTTNANGGGGGGGVLYATGLTITTGSFAVVIGQGGTLIGNSTIGMGNRGGNSSFGTTYIAQGGGGGGSTGVTPTATNMAGGSGGGAAWNQTTSINTATQTSIGGATGYGFAGGGSGVGYTGAGGGGAGSAGVAGSGSAPGGDGGQGRAFDISGSVVYYAGGGGGGGNSSERAGDGYAGGGRGEGQTTQYAYNSYPAQSVNAVTTGSSTPNAIPNTGGGGGGGSYWAANGGWGSGSGQGGSGIVIVRYKGAQTSSGGTITSTSGYTVHTFTLDGTFVFNGTTGLVVPTFRAPIQNPWSFAITGTTVVGFNTNTVISAQPLGGTFGPTNTVYIDSVDTVTNTLNCIAWANASYSTPPVSGRVTAIYPTGAINTNPRISAINTGSTGWQTTIVNIKGTNGLVLGYIFTATSITGSLGTGTTAKVIAVDSFTQITAEITGGTPTLGFIGTPTFTGSTGTVASSGDIAYFTTGTFTWVAPPGVTSVNVVAIGGGGGGGYQWSSGGGGGGGLGWKNNIPVTPGNSYTVVVGGRGVSNANASTAGSEGGNSYFISLATVAGYGGGQGGANATATANGYGGGWVGDGGGRGGNGAYQGSWTSAGAGAGGYSGNGADSGSSGGTAAPAGSGAGAAGGYYSSTYGVPAGGGVGVYGRGADGVARGQYLGGGGGSGGGNGRGGEGSGESSYRGITGGDHGGGGGGSGTSYGGGPGGVGAVRIIWGTGRAFPATNAGTLTTVSAVLTLDPTSYDDNIGGDSIPRKRLLGISNPAVKIQNTIPFQLLVNANSLARSTIKTYIHVPTSITNSSDYESAPSDTRVVNSSTTGTYIYRSTQINSSTWIFRIYNIPSATVSSLTTGTIITANTSSGQTGRFAVGSTVTVYSIFSATSIIATAYGGSSAPALGPIDSISAPGGTYVPSVTTYTAHIFTAVGTSTFTPSFSGLVDFLVVGGGGSGGSYVGGGGGAGGVRSTSSFAVVSGTAYSITVGAGGASVGSISSSVSSVGNDGQASSAFGVSATGGGGGGVYNTVPGRAGGSGGGGGGFEGGTAVGGTGIAGQGFAGGSAIGSRPRTMTAGAGGGGAGGLGGNSSDAINRGGDGGTGTISSFAGTPVYYGGGGGGGLYTNGTRPGNGGLGGGGGGAANTAGVSGIGGGSTWTGVAGGNGSASGDPNATGGAGAPNTGGGGGGMGHYGLSGAGGSGVVIIRYLGSQNATGGNTIVNYTADGLIPTPLQDLGYQGVQSAFVAVVPVSSATSYSKKRNFTSILQSTSGLPNNLGTIKNISPSPVLGSSATIYSTTPLTTNTWALGIYNVSSATVSSLTYGTIITVSAGAGNTGTGNTVYFYTATNSTSIVAVATGGTVAPIDGYTNGITVAGGTYTPTSSPAAPTTFEYFIVGGGGGSQVGGGGAGGITTGTSSVTAEYRYNLQAGAGGAAGQAGFGSSFEQTSVLGGGYGGANNVGTGVPGNGGGGGASGGGGGSPASPSYQFQQGGAGGGGGTIGQGNSGGSGGWYSGSAHSGGGGGGFTGAGGNGSGSDASGPWNGGAGGTGFSSNFSGVTVTYAQGGGGWGWTSSGTPSTAGALGTGNGGGGINNRGGSGIAMIRYPDSYAPAWAVTGNPTAAVTGGYRIYSWTNTTTNTTVAGTVQFAGPSGYIVPNLGVPGAPGPWTFTLSGMNTTAEFSAGSVITSSALTGSFGSNNTVRVLSVTSSTEMVCIARSGDVSPTVGNVAYIQPTGAVEFGPVISNITTVSSNVWSFTVSNLTATTMMQLGSVIVATTSSGGTGRFGTGTVYVTSIINISQIIAVSTGSNTPPVAGVISNVTTSGAIISTSGPAAAVYQVAFNGSNQYLSIGSNAQTAVESNNFTIEFWAYFTNATANALQCIYSNYTAWNSGSTMYFGKHTSNSGNLVVFLNNYSVSVPLVAESSLPPSNTWVHYALVRNGNTFTLYRNGAVSASNSHSGSVSGSSNPNFIGAAGDALGTYNFPGYISNFRIVKSAVYTTAFTTPTAEVGNIANTVLITCRSSTFIDNSVSALTISPANSPVISVGALSLMPPSVLGTADYSIVRFGPNVGRQENWDNIVATVAVNTLNRPVNYFGNETTEPKLVISTYSTTSMRNAVVPSFDLGFNTGRIVNLTTGSSGEWTFNIDRMTSTGAFTTGTIITAWSGQGSFGSDNNVVIVEAINSSTSMLCRARGLVAPSTGTIFAVAPSGALIIPPQITAVNPYSTDYSIITSDQNTYRTSFNGSSDYYTLSSNAFAFGTNNFTVEAWVWLNALPTSDAWPTSYSSHMVIATVGTPSAADGIGFMIGQTKLLIQNNDTQYASSSVHGLTTSTWNHVAYVRSSDVFNFYVNGISKGSVGFSGNVSSGSSGYLGCETGQGAFFNGRISNLRMVNGVAVYTGTFAPAGVLSKTQGAGSNIAAVTGNQTTLLAFAASNDTDLSNNNYTLTKVNSPTIAVTTLTGSIVTIGTINGWKFTLSNLSTTSTALLSNGSVILAQTGGSSTGNFGTGNTVYVNTITNGTQVSCVAVGGSTAPNVGTINSISTSGAIVTTTNILFSSAVSGGSFTVTNNSTVLTSNRSSVLFPITQSSGGVYFEYMPVTGAGTSWYVGVQRAPSRVGAYEAGVGATGNLGTGTVFYPTNGTTSSVLINLATTSTVSWNGSSEVVIPGTGQLYFGVYSSTSTSGSGTINWGTSSFATAIQPVPIANVSATGTSLGSVTYSVTGGSLPSGAYLNSSNGIIYWYKQNLAATSTTTNITVTASAAGSSETITKTFSLVIATAGGGSLYAFTTATFTPGSQTGNTGPSLAIAQAGLTITGDQTWKTNTAFFDVVSGIQIWTVPTSGTYRITANGARGGQSYNWGPQGGLGASMRGDFALVAGDKIKILVGQQGDGNTYDGGGGGGSFVTTFTNSPLIIAGGGGGGAPSGFSGSGGIVGRIVTSGGATAGGGGGTDGSGGGQWSGAGGGGGLTGNGGNAAGSWGGYSFTNGGQGGGAQARGGFGGGGSGGGTNGAGGGGGYSGGGGSAWSYEGGGGGSYNIGTNQVNTAGGAPANVGSVIIERI